MKGARQQEVRQTLFIRAIENGAAHKARLCFQRLRRLLERRPERSVAATLGVGLAESFQGLRAQVSAPRVSREVQRGLELLHVVVAGTLVHKRVAFDKLQSNTRQSTKRDMGRIMRLLSKKFLTKVDDKFLSEHIRVLILKNNIHNPSILNLVKQTDIDISQEDYAAQAKIQNTEALLQVFLAIELFLPLDLWVTKLKESYNRLFFRLLRSHAAARTHQRRTTAARTLASSLQQSLGRQVKVAFESLKQQLESARKKSLARAEGVEALVRALDVAAQSDLARHWKLLHTHCVLQRKLEGLSQATQHRLEDGLLAISKAAKAPKDGVECGQATDPVQLQSSAFSVFRNLVDKGNGLTRRAKDKVVQASSGTVDSDHEETGRGAGKRPEGGLEAAKTKFSKASTAVDGREGQGPEDRDPKGREKGVAAAGFGKKTEGAGDAGEKWGSVGPQNRYAKSSSVTLSPGGGARQNGTQIREGSAQDRNSKEEGGEAVDWPKLERFLQRMEGKFGVTRDRHSVVAFERLKEAVTVLEVLETKDRTKELEPIGVRAANDRPSQSQASSENTSANPANLLLEPSVRLPPGEPVDMVFIRKSHFFPVEAQVTRYSQIVKPQSQLLEEIAQVRKEDGSKRSFALPIPTGGHGRTRHLASSMVLEPVGTLDPPKRSFAERKEDSGAVLAPTSTAGKGLRARYK